MKKYLSITILLVQENKKFTLHYTKLFVSIEKEQITLFLQNTHFHISSTLVSYCSLTIGLR